MTSPTVRKKSSDQEKVMRSLEDFFPMAKGQNNFQKTDAFF